MFYGHISAAVKSMKLWKIIFIYVGFSIASSHINTWGDCKEQKY